MTDWIGIGLATFFALILISFVICVVRYYTSPAYDERLLKNEWEITKSHTEYRLLLVGKVFINQRITVVDQYTRKGINP